MDKLKEKIVNILIKKKYCSLATSDLKDVNNAMVGYYSEDLDLYFGSLNNTLKCRHILVNPQVAVCIDNVQIHGIANLLEKDTAMYKKYAKKYLEKFPYDKFYFEMENMNFYKIEPLVLWWFDLSGIYQREKLVIDNDYYQNLNPFENPQSINKRAVPWL